MRNDMAAAAATDIEISEKSKKAADDPTAGVPAEKSMSSKLVRALTTSINYNIHAAVKEDEQIQAIHDNAEKFDPKTEAVFAYIQILTATCVSFAHGANGDGLLAPNVCMAPRPSHAWREWCRCCQCYWTIHGDLLYLQVGESDQS